MRRLLDRLVSRFAWRRAAPDEVPRERFTDQALKVWKLAEEEFRRLNHEYLSTDHVLYGLIQNERGIAASMLTSMGIELGRARDQLRKIMIPGPKVRHVRMQVLTPRLKKALSAAIDEAEKRNQKFIGSEHLLLGLLQDPEGISAAMFAGLGWSADLLRQRIGSCMDGRVG